MAIRSEPGQGLPGAADSRSDLFQETQGRTDEQNQKAIGVDWHFNRG